MVISKQSLDGLRTEILKSGVLVGETYELVGKHIGFFGTIDAVKREFEITDEFEKEFIGSICKFEPKNIGPYDTSKYFFLIPSLKEAVAQLKEDNYNTRRAVISFPKEHCFQSIQFLVRENTIKVVCFMRSCDVVKNFAHDVWLCYKLAEIFASYMEKTLEVSPYKCYSLDMMFGSLHMYLGDAVDDVLRDA